MKLPDGTVLASAYRAQPAALGHGYEHIKKSNHLKIGTIVSVRNVDSTEGIQKSANNTSDGSEGTPYETVYDVRVDDHNARPFMYTGARVLKPFMGANNYFEIIHESADLSPTYAEKLMFASHAESLVGSRCVLLCIEGEPTAPVIVGFLQHPARPSKVTKDKELHLEFEFNGFNCSIDKDGAFLIKANAPKIPAIAPPVGAVPDVDISQNPLVGPFTISLDADKVFSIKDNLDQEIRIDRSAMEIEITNGGESIKLVKSLIPGMGEMLINVGNQFTFGAKKGVVGFDLSLDLNTKQLTIAADVKMGIDTGDFTLSSKLGIKADATQIALTSKTTFEVKTTTMSFTGASGELLAILKEIFDGIGTITANSPIGPCAPLTASPQWVQVQLALVKFAALMG